MQIITKTISNLIQRRNQTVETRSAPQYKKISSGFYVSVDERGISIFKEPIWRLNRKNKNYAGVNMITNKRIPAAKRRQSI
jgi:hypothetical protein